MFLNLAFAGFYRARTSVSFCWTFNWSPEACFEFIGFAFADRVLLFFLGNFTAGEDTQVSDFSQSLYRLLQ